MPKSVDGLDEIFELGGTADFTRRGTRVDQR
jgi:hypothetical protein